MKKCLQCQKPAVTHITEIQGGEAQPLHLCESCTQEYLSTADHQLPSSPDDITSKISQLTEDEDLDDMDNVSCSDCGISFSDFRAKGRLSCPRCYDSFGEELRSLLESIHGYRQHTGKFPRSNPGRSEKHYALIKLRNQLREAITDEDYESAASLRDEIQALEQTLAEDASQ